MRSFVCAVAAIAGALALVVTMPAHAAAAAAAAASPPASQAPSPGGVQATLPKPPAPQTKPVPELVPPPASGPKVAPGGVAVTVERFEITGNTVFAEAALQARIRQYVGKSLTLAGIYDVAKLLTRFYQDHGYGLARVAVPTQKFTSGTVKLEVIEGHIGKVRVEGNSRTHADVILDSAAAIEPGSVFTNAAASRAVLLVNDLPGVQARAVMVPGAEFGTADMVLNVNETHYQGDVSLDNYGRSSLGRWRLSAGGSINSLTGHGDRLSARFLHSQSSLLNYGTLSYSLPLGASGGTLTTSYNRVLYHVGGSTFGPLDINGTSNGASTLYMYPAIRSVDRNLYWGIGFQHTSSQSEASSKPVTGNTINVLEATLYYTRARTDGSYYTLSGQFFTNGKSNDGRVNSSGSYDSSGERARVVLGGSYALPFATRWRLVTNGEVQWSPNPLVDNDKYSLGGPDSVRGFLSAEVRGDSGAYVSAEIQRQISAEQGLALGAFVDSARRPVRPCRPRPSHRATVGRPGG